MAFITNQHGAVKSLLKGLVACLLLCLVLDMRPVFALCCETYESQSADDDDAVVVTPRSQRGQARLRGDGCERPGGFTRPHFANRQTARCKTIDSSREPHSGCLRVPLRC